MKPKAFFLYSAGDYYYPTVGYYNRLLFSCTALHDNPFPTPPIKSLHKSPM